MLTKKDYERLAEVIKRNTVPIRGLFREREIPLVELLIDLCNWLREDNPNFDGQRFLEACGVSANDIVSITKRGVYMREHGLTRDHRQG